MTKAESESEEEDVCDKEEVSGASIRPKVSLLSPQVSQN